MVAEAVLAAAVGEEAASVAAEVAARGLRPEVERAGAGSPEDVREALVPTHLHSARVPGRMRAPGVDRVAAPALENGRGSALVLVLAIARGSVTVQELAIVRESATVLALETEP